jgi:sec-independent protein translocase protein TatA
MLGFGGPQELLVILLIVLVIFGGKKIPELMGGLGKGVRNFKKGINEVENLDEEETKKIEEDKGEDKS